jgi:hypothetical protein
VYRRIPRYFLPNLRVCDLQKCISYCIAFEEVLGEKWAVAFYCILSTIMISGEDIEIMTVEKVNNAEKADWNKKQQQHIVH